MVERSSDDLDENLTLLEWRDGTLFDGGVIESPTFGTGCLCKDERLGSGWPFSFGLLTD